MTDFEQVLAHRDINQFFFNQGSLLEIINLNVEFLDHFLTLNQT